MPGEAVHPTPYPDVNALLGTLLAGVRAILGDQFVGLYLHGSLAAGDFGAGSDIDFAVVTANELPEETVRALGEMHARLRASDTKWAAKLEGPYIPRQMLRRYHPAQTRCPWLGVDGHFAVEQLGPDWVLQSHVLREQGVAVTGPPPRTLIDPISPDDLRHAVRETLRLWWAPMLDDLARLQEYVLVYQHYAVLTMCRMLYTLHHGTVASKSVAARWAQEELGERWGALITWALEGREGDRSEAVVGLVRSVMEKGG